MKRDLVQIVVTSHATAPKKDSIDSAAYNRVFPSYGFVQDKGKSKSPFRHRSVECLRACDNRLPRTACSLKRLAPGARRRLKTAGVHSKPAGKTKPVRSFVPAVVQKTFRPRKNGGDLAFCLRQTAVRNRPRKTPGSEVSCTAALVKRKCPCRSGRLQHYRRKSS